MPRVLGGTTDYIEWYLSPATGREFPVYVFCADVDFATSGYLALTSISRPESVRGEYTAREWNSWSRSKTPFVVERRLNRRLGRDDLRVPVLIGAGPGEYGEYELFYRDLFGEGTDGMIGEEATHVRDESVAEFLASGGTILDCPGRHRKVVPATTRRKVDKKTAKRSPAKRKQSGST